MKSIGTTIWLTGLTYSGKTTLATELTAQLKERGLRVHMLDGDELREGVGHLFGYSREERIKMSTITRFIAKMLNDKGEHVVIASLTPYEEVRDTNRKQFQSYCEVFVDCPLEVCMQRDQKNFYQNALNGITKNVVGIDDVFEIPLKSDVHVKTAERTVEQCVKQILPHVVPLLEKGTVSHG